MTGERSNKTCTLSWIPMLNIQRHMQKNADKGNWSPILASQFISGVNLGGLIPVDQFPHINYNVMINNNKITDILGGWTEVNECCGWQHKQWTDMLTVMITLRAMELWCSVFVSKSSVIGHTSEQGSLYLSPVSTGRNAWIWMTLAMCYCPLLPRNSYSASCLKLLLGSVFMLPGMHHYILHVHNDPWLPTTWLLRIGHFGSLLIDPLAQNQMCHKLIWFLKYVDLTTIQIEACRLSTISTLALFPFLP